MTTCVDLGIMTIAQFNNRFEIIDRIGAGEFGIVFRIIDKNEILAFKLILETSKMSEEIMISCTLDPLRSYTDSLIQIYSFGKLTDLNYFKKWLSVVPESGDFYITPLYEIITSDQWSLKEQTEILFEIIYTVLILNRYGILHNDLNAGNIVYKRVNYKRQYTINDTTMICDGNYIPIIIDFGEARRIIPLSNFSKAEVEGFMNALFGFGFKSQLEFDMELKKKVEELLLSLRADILLDPLFKMLTNHPVEGGDLIKIF